MANLPTWAEAGHAEYFTDAVTLGLVQGILFNWVEVLRWKDMRKPGCVNEVRPAHAHAQPHPTRSQPTGEPRHRAPGSGSHSRTASSASFLC